MWACQCPVAGVRITSTAANALEYSSGLAEKFVGGACLA
jgi:hypothetical protein